MKKPIVFFIFLISFASCKKKEYNCFCGTTMLYSQNYGGGQTYFVSNNKPMTEKMTEKQGKSVCDQEAENISDVYKSSWLSYGNSLNDISITTNCTLE